MARVVAITQARMTSTRLPGKILKTTRGKTLLEWHVERLKRCPLFSEVVIATTVNATDDPVIAEAKRLGVRAHRGSEEDVLSRFIGAAKDSRPDIVVRVTSDCPLWDPAEGGRVVEGLMQDPPADYASNSFERTYPRGLDTEALWYDVLLRMQRLAPQGQCPEREHVTIMINASRRELFLRRSVATQTLGSDLRWLNADGNGPPDALPGPRASLPG